MPIGMFFWLLMVIWLLFGPGYGFYAETPNRKLVNGGNLLLFILLFLVGWKLFGFAVHG